jgi:hypothetical protein
VRKRGVAVVAQGGERAATLSNFQAVAILMPGVAPRSDLLLSDSYHYRPSLMIKFFMAY